MNQLSSEAYGSLIFGPEVRLNFNSSSSFADSSNSVSRSTGSEGVGIVGMASCSVCVSVCA